MRRQLCRTGLWRHRDFLKLWSAQTISQFGSQITTFALPLIAVLTLQATAFQVGLLAALGTAPSLLVGLFAGVWVDRHRRRPIMIVMDLGRAATLLALPLAALAGYLSLPLLYAVALLHGTLTIFFNVAYTSYLPSLIASDALVDGNSKLQTSRTAAQVAGPGLAGGLVRFIAAPFVILLDCLSFLFSAFFIARIRHTEQRSLQEQKAQRERRVLREIGEGVRFIAEHPILRILLVCDGVIAFFKMVMFAVLTIYALRELHIDPGLLGLTFALGNVGWLVGAVVAKHIAQRLGIGRAILLARVIGGVGGVSVALAAGPLAVAVPLLIVGMSLDGLSALIYTIPTSSVTQAMTPTRLLGRVSGASYFIGAGVLPLGALLGGALGGLVGLHTTLWISTLGEALAFAVVFVSPLRRLQALPARQEELRDEEPAEETARYA